MFPGKSGKTGITRIILKFYPVFLFPFDNIWPIQTLKSTCVFQLATGRRAVSAEHEEPGRATGQEECYRHGQCYMSGSHRPVNQGTECILRGCQGDTGLISAIQVPPAPLSGLHRPCCLPGSQGMFNFFCMTRKGAYKLLFRGNCYGISSSKSGIKNIDVK